ncbi:hypothetical protein PG984_004617 [Apiospora sp. TS-2023a]
MTNDKSQNAMIKAQMQVLPTRAHSATSFRRRKRWAAHERQIEVVRGMPSSAARSIELPDEVVRYTCPPLMAKAPVEQR